MKWNQFLAVQVISASSLFCFRRQKRSLYDLAIAGLPTTSVQA